MFFFYTVLWCVSLVGFVLINIHSPTLIFIAQLWYSFLSVAVVGSLCGLLINPLWKLAIFLLITLTHVASMLSHYRQVAALADSLYRISANGTISSVHNRGGCLQQWPLWIVELFLTASTSVGMGNISILSYIVILRAHDNRIVVVLQLLSYRLHNISGAFT